MIVLYLNKNPHQHHQHQQQQHIIINIIINNNENKKNHDDDNNNNNNNNNNNKTSPKLELVKTYSYTIANTAIWLATLLTIYSSIDIE